MRADAPDRSSDHVPSTAVSSPFVAIDWASLWADYGSHFEGRVDTLAGDDEYQVRHELLFCLLGGHGVPYELGRSAADHLAALEVFAPDRQDEELEELVYDELNAPNFEPRRKDGGLRRYRYPRRKAAQIVMCRSWLGEIGLLTEALLEVPCERARRRLLCECPGLGPKSASWLLRNCGLSEGLAILDVHVLRILAGTGRLEPVSMPRDYEFAERVYLGWCAELGASAAAFDLLLWEFSRALRP